MSTQPDQVQVIRLIHTHPHLLTRTTCFPLVNYTHGAAVDPPGGKTPDHRGT